jgi:hypothetical protein
MTDIILEILRAIIVGTILLVFWGARHKKGVSEIDGWWYLVIGFMLIFFGTLIDITDNFEELNRFVVIGDTETQAFLEKVVGYLFGFISLAFGIWRWLPKIVEHTEMSRKELEVSDQRLRVLRATMRTVQDIFNNFLQNVQLFQMEAEEKNALDPESLKMIDSAIKKTTKKLTKLGNLDSTPEKQMAGGVGIDYEQIPSAKSSESG